MLPESTNGRAPISEIRIHPMPTITKPSRATRLLFFGFDRSSSSTPGTADTAMVTKTGAGDSRKQSPAIRGRISNAV